LRADIKAGLPVVGNPTRLGAQKLGQQATRRCRRFGFDLLKNLCGDFTPGNAHTENLRFGRHGVQPDKIWDMVSPEGEGEYFPRVSKG
jgi:hypothetical protein